MLSRYSNVISVSTPATFQFTINTNNTSTGSTTNTQFKLPLVSSLPLNAVVDWGDNTTDTITTWNQAETTHTYASAGNYTIKITGQLSGWQFNNGGDRLKILNIASWGALNISVDRGFFGCTNLTSSATDAPTISSTSLNRFFVSCASFNGAIGNWNVSSVIDMDSTFRFATSFNQNIGSWNTSAVTNMQEMFRNASAFNQNIGSWNVANVTNFTNFMEFKTNLNYSAANLDAIYNGWSASGVKPNITINFGTIKYTAAGQAGKDILVNTYNWTCTDGGI